LTAAQNIVAVEPGERREPEINCHRKPLDPCLALAVKQLEQAYLPHLED
jgi:hypothetical protein